MVASKTTARAAELSMKRTNNTRLNPTRPYVEGVHKKKTDPEFKAWFVENKDQFAPWFVKGVIEGSNLCTAHAVWEWEKATGKAYDD